MLLCRYPLNDHNLSTLIPSIYYGYEKPKPVEIRLHTPLLLLICMHLLCDLINPFPLLDSYYPYLHLHMEVGAYISDKPRPHM